VESLWVVKGFDVIKDRSRASARVRGLSSKHSVLKVVMNDSAKGLSYGLAGRLKPIFQMSQII
jgi:hypothetical protein